MPDDHSKLVPPLPISNRTVKRFYANDSAATSVKVGYRQALYYAQPPWFIPWGFLLLRVELRDRSALESMLKIISSFLMAQRIIANISICIAK